MADNPFIQRRALGTEGYRPREVEVWGGGPQIIAGAVDIQPPHVEIERRRGVESPPVEGRLPMFWTRVSGLPQNENDPYVVTVQPGLIAETIVSSEGKPITRYHPVPAEVQPPAPGDPEPEPPDPITLGDGQVVFLVYETDEVGAIKEGTAVLAVGADDAYDDADRSYPPAPGAEEGTEGSRAVKIARLDLVEGIPTITQIWRDPWQHNQDLPTLLNKAEGDAQVYKGFDSATGKYEFRALIKGAWEQVNITQTDDEVFIEGNDKQGKLYYQVEGDSEAVEILDWKDGLVTTEDAPVIPIPQIPDPPEIPTVSQRATDPQVHVTLNGLDYLVEGNSKDGTLEIQFEGASTPAVALEWVDGLMTNEGATLLEIPAPPGSSGDDFDVEFTTLIFFQDAGGVLEVSEDTGVIREFHVRGGAWRIGPSDDDLEVRTLRIPGRIIAPNDTGDPFPELP